MKPALLGVAILLLGCASSAHEANQSATTGGTVPGKAGAADAAYDRLAEEYLRGYFAWRPQAAVALGLHEFDGGVSDVSRDSITKELARLRASRVTLAALDSRALSAATSTSLRNLLAGIDGDLFNFEVANVYTRNPMTYTDLIDVNMYAKRDYAPLATRAKAITSALRRMPAVLAAGRENLAPVMPQPLIETAMSNGKGVIEFINGDLVTALAPLKDQPVMAEFTKAKDEASSAMTAFVDWLKTDCLPRADKTFALGRGAYTKLLAGNELISQTPEQILEIGLKELKAEQARFAAAAQVIDPAKKPIDVFKAIQHDHPTAEGLLPDTRRNLEAIRQYLVDHDIISIPSEVRVKVQETPQYARATSFASMDTPGPFEKTATEAYYYVTPTEKEWTAEKKEEWLTSFNYYTTDVVTIHEAYPGHYVQFLHLNASNTDRPSKVFGSYAFIEGWAHYTEQMLLEEGFGSGTDPVRAAKYRLAQSDEALLRICRLCMSIRMHCDGWTLEQATKFFMENCFYEEAPARMEALRGASDPGYLFYTVGKLELLKLRADWRRQEGAAWSLKRFHDTVLSHGMPPIRLLRELMLKDPGTWGDLF